MSYATPRRTRSVIATGSTLLLSGLAFSATLAAQQLAPLPARLAEALHGQSATSRVPLEQLPARSLGNKAPGSLAPSPEGAPANILFTANFNDCGRDPPVPAPPAGPYPTPPQFTVYNVDNRTPATQVNYVNNAWIVREDFKFNISDCVIFSTSWYSPAGAANDWATFPTAAAGKITPTANTELRWNAVAYDPSYPDGYEVRYSTAGTAPADFLANPTLFFIGAESANWTARTVSLAALAGTPIHLAFRNNSTDKFLLILDDIVVENLVQFDPTLTGFGLGDAGTYGAVPAWLGVPYDVSATVGNSGVNTLTGVTVDTDALVDAVAVDSATSSPLASLAPGATANVAAISGLLDQIGRWTVEGTVDAVEGDEVPANSSAEAYLVHVTENEITRAVPDEPQSGTLGIGAGNGGELGNDFVIDTAAKIVSIEYTIENSDTLPDNPDPDPDGDGVGDFNGIALQATLRGWDTVADEPGPVLHTVDVVVPADAPVGPLTLGFPLPAGTVLAPGRYLVAAVEPQTPPVTITLHNVAGRFTPGTSWVDWPTNPDAGWSNVEAFGAPFSHPFRISAFLVPPVLVPVAADDAFTLDEDTVFTGDVSANDTQSDDGGNTFALDTDAEHGTVDFNTDGSFTYTPNADFNGADSFTYTLCDADEDCDTATVSLTIDPVDDAPAAADDSFTVVSDDVLIDSVATNDTPSPDGDNVWSVTVEPTSGTLVMTPDGSFSYTPSAPGTVSFEYELCVDGRTTDCATATVSVTIDAADIAPVAADDSFTVPSTDVLIDSVAGNDTPSPDGDNVWSVTVEPTSGTLVMAPDGGFTYTPSAPGTVSFEYELCVDGRTADCATATATIEVTEVIPLPPEIFADSFESQ